MRVMTESQPEPDDEERDPTEDYRPGAMEVAVGTVVLYLLIHAVTRAVWGWSGWWTVPLLLVIAFGTSWLIRNVFPD